MTQTLTQLRTSAAPLLSTKPADALAYYFALEHDERRTKLFVREDSGHRPLAFVAICQTGIDLFRPLVVARGDDSAAFQDILREALNPRRQYLFSVPVTLRNDLAAVASLHSESVNNVFALSATDFDPVVNVMVQSSETPDKQLRAVIKARDNTNAAEAGTSWLSKLYAEVYVTVVAGVRRRGLGKSCVSKVAELLFDQQKTPIYVTAQDNVASRKLAEKLGFKDTGAHELAGAMSIES